MARNKKFDKSEVVKDAMLLFWEKGFYQTSVQDLVQEIGINRASLYDTYHDKEGLFKESFEFYKESVRNNIEEIFSKHTTIKAGFNEFIEYLLTDLLVDQYGCLISNSYSELLPAKNQDLEAVLENTRKMWSKIIISLLEKAKVQNELIDSNLNLKYAADSIYINIVGTAMLSKTKIENKKLKYNLELMRDKVLFK
tara:strand:- start:686 stop:1273 length:588 start_codon:yes stop_codon:yes gene_type:complete